MRQLEQTHMQTDTHTHTAHSQLYRIPCAAMSRGLIIALKNYIESTYLNVTIIDG